jgi:O-6-methylguanine DNA methyltransferase
MATDSIEIDDLAEFALAGLPEAIREEADPVFLRKLRRETRGAHARASHRLNWFDIEVPVGTLRVVHDGDLVHLVTNDPNRFESLADERLGFEPERGGAVGVERAVQRVLAGRARGSDIAYLAALPAFQQGVLRATASIPRGEVRPYNWVAKQAGSPGAVRAAGTALGHNPVPFIVPCHRVVRSDWSLGEYSAGGTQVKDRILRWEGAELELLEALPPSVRFIGDLRDMSLCLPPCSGLLHQPRSRLVFFSDANDAEREGFHACAWCLPL